MLPLWRDSLRVVLCPNCIILLVLGKGFRRQVKLQKILECPASLGVSDWHSMLAVFKQWVGTNEVDNADVTVILSNHFARYAVMPFSEQVNSQTEEQAVAQILFEGIYGEVAKQWRIQVSESGYGESRLVAAVELQLLDELAQVLLPTRLRLKSIVPHGVVAFNALANQVIEPNCLFVVRETSLVVVMTFKSGQLTHISRALVSDNQAASVIQREALTNGLDLNSTEIYLHAPSIVGGDLSFAGIADVKIERLQIVNKNGEPAADARFEMMCVPELV